LTKWRPQLIHDRELIRVFHMEHGPDTPEDGFDISSWAPDTERFGWLGVYDGDDRLAGIGQLQPVSGVSLEIHIMVGVPWRPRFRYAIGDAILGWVFEETGYTTVTTLVPDNFPHVRMYAQGLGFTESGRIPASVSYGGRLEDQSLMVLTRPDWRKRKWAA
jgi:RimJ/RimL family protein N-acetyltransferase